MATISYQSQKSLSTPWAVEKPLELLFREFEKEYDNYYRKEIEKFQNRYPDITNPNRRTRKSLKNICFFIWYYTQGEKNKLFNTLFKSSVLLSSQDDFCDNPQISNFTKQEFYSICDNLLEGKNHQLTSTYTPQFQELIALWKEIVEEIKNSPSQTYSFWKEAVKQMNDAMRKEEYKPRGHIIPFDEYMEIATYSIGAIFIWATYLAIKKVPIKTLEALETSFLNGAVISRLSNDIASYRENKNKINAVNIIRDKKDPEEYILGLIRKERQKLNKNLKKLNIEEWIKQMIQLSTEFLIKFYQKSDFTKNCYC